MREFEQFTEPEGSFHDIQYIHNFELNCANNTDETAGEEKNMTSPTGTENDR